MLYKVTGTVPTPQYNPDVPVFGHHISTMPSGKSYDVGEAGRTISVVTDNESRAKELQSIFEKVYINVKLEKVK